jgi:GT2 family glycosyltransferase
MKPELVSIVIAVYNGRDLIDEQLDALAGQDYDGPVEVILSDNDSTDGLRDHIAAHPLRSRLDLRWVAATGERGVSFARNRGIDAARGDFLIIVDHDDRAHPGWLRAMVRAAQTCDAVGGALETDTLNSPVVARWRGIPKPADCLHATPYLPWAQGNNFGMWRMVVDKVGAFDENLLGGAEDVDLSWRIQQAGLTLGRAPDALMAYRLRPTYRETYRQSKGYGHGGIQAARKHRAHGAPYPSAPTIALVLVVIVVAFPLVAPFATLRGAWVSSVGMAVGALAERRR